MSLALPSRRASPRATGRVPTRILTRGLVGSVLVLLGGLVVSVVPASSWVNDDDVLVVLRSLEPGRMLGLTVVMAGLGLLAHSWLALCRYVVRAGRAGRAGHEGDPAGTLALTRAAAALWSLPLLVAPPLFSRDGWSYAAQGVLSHVGVSPYLNGPGVLRGPITEAVDPRWMFSPAPYGPVPITLGDLFAHVTTDPWVLVLAHRGVALLGLVLLAWAIPRLAAWSGADPALASIIGLASPFVLANGVGGLHNDLLMVGLMAVALVVAVERGWVWGAALAGLAGAVKAPGVLVCIAVALVTLPLGVRLLDRARRLVATGLVALTVVLGLGLVLGTGHGWVDALGVPGRVNTVLSLTTLVGGAGDWLAGVVGVPADPATYLTRTRLVGQGVAVGVAAWVALRWPSGERTAALSGMTLVMGTLVLLSPVVHLWYFLWVLPFITTQRLSLLARSAVVVLSVVLGLVAPLDSSLHGAYLAIVLGTMLAVVLVLVLLATPGARERVRRIAAAPWGAEPVSQPVTQPVSQPVSEPAGPAR